MQKNYSLLVGVLLFIGCSVSGQIPNNYIAYEYDNSGNRTDRMIVLIPNRPNSQQGIENTAALNDKSQTQSNLKETVAGVTLNIYPNPTKSTIKLTLNSLSNLNSGVISIYSMDGKEIYSNQTVTSSTVFDLSDKPDGMYILRILINNTSVDWKIIKHKEF